ncbi:MAG: methyltransferase dimerization domain-containing protein [Spirochaetales bacterium]|nr:methyltransferase dimerization domain-containing protein [Spirochaetales bacterium]
MSLLVKPDVPMDRLKEILNGYKEMKLLFTAIELDVFSALTEEITAAGCAEKLNLNARNMEYFLNALAAMELLAKKDGKYKNTELSNAYLVKDADLYMGEYFLFREEFTGIGDVKACLKDGPEASVVKDNRGRDVFDFAHLAELSVNEQRMGRAEQTSEAITSIFKDRKFDKMVDIGGGSGVIALAIAEKNPETECYVFDSKEVIEAATKIIGQYDGENRVKTISGDYVTDDIGSGYDLILAIASIQFAKNNFETVLTKIHNSLNDDGLFISFCGATSCERTKPKDLVLGWLGSHLRGLDVLPEKGELCSEIEKYGFKLAWQPGIPVGMEVFRKS